MIKIVINACHGGFGLSEEAVLRYAQIKGVTLYPEYSKYSNIAGPTWWTVPPEQQPKPLTGRFINHPFEVRRAYNAAYTQHALTVSNIPRNDPALVQAVEELGGKADGRHAQLKIVEIPDDVDWVIEDYDGAEWVAERHRTWS